jgi:hypothetical protein
VRRYATAIDRDSAHEMLTRRMKGGGGVSSTPASGPSDSTDDDLGLPEVSEVPEDSTVPEREIDARPPAWSEILNSPLARTIANQVTRGLMGALLGPPPRRRRRR